MNLEIKVGQIYKFMKRADEVCLKVILNNSYRIDYEFENKISTCSLGHFKNLIELGYLTLFKDVEEIIPKELNRLSLVDGD